jgi:hypothetical protein
MPNLEPEMRYEARRQEHKFRTLWRAPHERTIADRNGKKRSVHWSAVIEDVIAGTYLAGTHTRGTGCALITPDNCPLSCWVPCRVRRAR